MVKPYELFKGKVDILKSMPDREEFLSKKDRRIVFHYTLKHASGMDQIETGFGMLMRKVVERGSFYSEMI